MGAAGSRRGTPRKIRSCHAEAHVCTADPGKKLNAAVLLLGGAAARLRAAQGCIMNMLCTSGNNSPARSTSSTAMGMNCLLSMKCLNSVWRMGTESDEVPEESCRQASHFDSNDVVIYSEICHFIKQKSPY